MGSLADLVNQKAKKSEPAPEAPRAGGTQGAVEPQVDDTRSASESVGSSGESGKAAVSPSPSPTPATSALQELLTPNTEANLEARVEAAKSAVTQGPMIPTPLQGEVDIDSIKDQTGKMKAKEGLDGFLENLREIPNLFDNPEILSAQIRSIMVDLQENPHFAPHIEENDIGMMVRGMRESLGVAQIKKAENKAKRGGGGKKGAMTNALAMSFQELGGIKL